MIRFIGNLGWVTCLTGIPLVREQDGLGSVGLTEFAALRYRRSRTGILPVLACFLPAGPAGCIPIDLKFQTIWRTESVLPTLEESTSYQPPIAKYYPDLRGGRRRGVLFG